MTSIDSPGVISRSNSDLCNIELIKGNTSLSPTARMELISGIVAGWDRATAGHPSRYGAKKEIANRTHIGTPAP